MKRFLKIFLLVQFISLSLAPVSYGKYFVVTESPASETAEDFFRSCVNNNSEISDRAEEDCERQALQHPSLKEDRNEADSRSEEVEG